MTTPADHPLQNTSGRLSAVALAEAMLSEDTAGVAALLPDDLAEVRGVALGAARLAATLAVGLADFGGTTVSAVLAASRATILAEARR